MNCDCGSATWTTDTRKIDLGVWRRRECKSCGAVMTTLEQKCETAANPYRSSKTGNTVQGLVAAPPIPENLPRPNPPEKRSKIRRADDFKPAAFAPKEKETRYNVGRPASVPVDRITPTARDRIEDMKAEREFAEHGWDE